MSLFAMNCCCIEALKSEDRVPFVAKASGAAGALGPWKDMPVASSRKRTGHTSCVVREGPGPGSPSEKGQG